jgi:phosphoglycolate phosphatase-like HAD superfamily hydrolase
MYQEYGDDIVAKVKGYHLTHGGVSRYDKFRYFSKELLGKELTGAELDILGIQFSKLVENAVVEAPYVGGALEFLERYYTQFPLYVVSATPTDELVRIVSRRNMQRYFRKIYGSPTTKGCLISNILSENVYEKNMVVMVGDALADYSGAMDAGVRFIGRVAKENDNIFPPDVDVIRDLSGLKDIVFS